MARCDCGRRVPSTSPRESPCGKLQGSLGASPPRGPAANCARSCGRLFRNIPGSRGITQNGEALRGHLGRPSSGRPFIFTVPWLAVYALAAVNSSGGLDRVSLRPPFRFHCSVARRVLLHRLPRIPFLTPSFAIKITPAASGRGATYAMVKVFSGGRSRGNFFSTSRTKRFAPIGDAAPLKS
jgi:hypothetical protein